MRFPLLIAASLLATACDSPATEESRSQTAGDMAENDASGAFADQPPSALGFTQAVANSDMYEIAAGNVALDKAESDEVREFARMMVADHSRSSQALEDAVTSSGQTLSMAAQLDPAHQAQVDILRSLQGDAFDREYLSQQLAVHSDSLVLLKAYGANGDVAELRQFAQSTIPVVQKHHDWLQNNSPTPGASMGNTGATPAR